MTEDAGLDIDWDAQNDQAIEGRAIALQLATDPELGGKPEVQKAAARRVVTLNGREFRLSQRTGLMPLLKFAHAANSGLDTSDMRSFDAMYEMLQDVIQEPVPPCGKCPVCLNGQEDECQYADPGDWDKFERHATATKADAEDLLDVVGDAIQIITARPTGSPGSSSDGRRPGSPSSTGGSSGRRGAGSAGSRRARRAT